MPQGPHVTLLSGWTPSRSQGPASVTVWFSRREKSHPPLSTTSGFNCPPPGLANPVPGPQGHSCSRGWLTPRG